ncbi:MAG: DUF1669 domain-containing protein [Anaerolineales bacterium]|nr:DUF1669 domain-containing protein [Anaerolineales bacterium]
MIRFWLILMSLMLALSLAACQESTPAVLAPVPSASPADAPVSDWLAVYFTDPTSPTAGTYRGGPDSALAEAIGAARFSVDAAIYHLNLWSIRDALIAAHQRGVQVRVVVESDNLDEVEVQDLRQAGIEVLGDRRESLMHHKFVVIDGLEVWTGSMNFTINGAYRNDNNLLRLRSSQLAENFTTEFEEMFVEDLFGNNIRAATPHPALTINGVQVETYFSPDDGVQAHIVDLIAGAQERVDFMAFSFTADPIAEALLASAGRGVAVTGVFEESQYYSNQGGEFERLRAAGLPIYLDGNHSNMHHKVLVIDGQIVITGSYNFSRSAEEFNDENVLILYSPELAAEYLAEFQRVIDQAKK